MSEAKVSLRGLEIITTYRGSNIERQENLHAVLRHLDLTYSDYSVWLLEADRKPTFQWSELGDSEVRHVFISDDGPFPKAQLCNLGARLSRSEIICFHDIDMVALPRALRYCLDDLLDKEGRDAWGPFERIVNVSGDLRQAFLFSGDYALFEPYSGPDTELCTDMSILYMANAGGIVLFRRERFCEIGGYDASFVGWGGEDDEILSRSLRLGLMWTALIGMRLFHLNHDSKTRAGWDSTPLAVANRQAAAHTRDVPQEEFEALVSRLRAQF